MSSSTSKRTPRAVSARQVVARYLTWPKFISMLRDGLHFRRLSAFEDRYEGLLTPGEVDHLAAEQARLHPDARLAVPYKEAFAELRRLTFVCPWYAGATESDSAWERYAPDGVAVFTTVGRLRRSLAQTSVSARIARVVYEFPSDVLGWPNPELVVFRKRPLYRDDREVRIATKQPGIVGDDYTVPVRQRELITAVRLAPGSPDWIRRLVRELLKEVGVSPSVVRGSERDIPPSYKSRVVQA